MTFLVCLVTLAVCAYTLYKLNELDKFLRETVNETTNASDQ